VQPFRDPAAELGNSGVGETVAAGVAAGVAGCAGIAEQVGPRAVQEFAGDDCVRFALGYEDRHSGQSGR
jgi:hypothetical protein